MVCKFLLYDVVYTYISQPLIQSKHVFQLVCFVKVNIWEESMLEHLICK